MDLSNTLRIMEVAAIKAGRHLRTLDPKTTQLPTKKDFLTSADLESDSIIRKILAKHFPYILYTSEEMENDDPSVGERWKVDPIDSTLNFFRGDENYAVSIAYVKYGETMAGVIYFPAKNMLFGATADSNAALSYPGRRNAKPHVLSVSNDETLGDSQFWIEWCKDSPVGKATEQVEEVLRKLRRVSLYPQIRNCAAGDPMAVARGIIGGFVMTKPDPFDVAAAGLIVRQAGGTVTDFEGRPWNANSKSIVATNGKLHAALLALLNS